jgi:hypothetical protein
MTGCLNISIIIGYKLKNHHNSQSMIKSRPLWATLKPVLRIKFNILGQILDKCWVIEQITKCLILYSSSNFCRVKDFWVIIIKKITIIWIIPLLKGVNLWESLALRWTLLLLYLKIWRNLSRCLCLKLADNSQLIIIKKINRQFYISNSSHSLKWMVTSWVAAHHCQNLNRLTLLKTEQLIKC